LGARADLPAAPENGDDAPSPIPAASGATLGEIHLCNLADDVLRMAAVIAVLAIGVILWLQKTEYFWRNPIGAARFQTVTDFDGVRRPPLCHATDISWRFLSTRRTDGRLG